MDFFASQDVAKRNTGKLIALFALAVVSLIVITNVAVMFALGMFQVQAGGAPSSEVDWPMFVGVSAAVLAIILLGSLYKISALSGGGARVAEMMNGRLVLSGSGNLYEQRVLNVVEEMALASGTPVPPVYLMEEAGINAFAAGYSPSDAVIGVTRGTIETLTRDQLQGVVAHEFSHILHGDMRINIRLIGVLHGILILGIVGYHLTRGSMLSRRSKNGGAIIAAGLSLVVLGFVGTFFGNLIKAAVSRQREYLADASAVQFTRNPEGIGHALMRIATHSERSHLDNPNSNEISHALFEEASVSSLSGLYATHPPLDERIKAVLPGWSGDYNEAKKDDGSASNQSATINAKSSESPADIQAKRQQVLNTILTAGAAVSAGGQKPTANAAASGLAQVAISSTGNPQSEHVDYAAQLLQQLPPALLDAARQPSSARALIYYLVLDVDSTEREQQLLFLKESADLGVYQELMSLGQTNATDEAGADKVAGLVEPEFRLALVNVALASLRQLSAPQYVRFKANFSKLIAMDKKISLLEWALQKIVFHHLDTVFDKSYKPKYGNRNLSACQQAVGVVMSMLAHAGRQTGISTEQAYQQGASELSGFNYPLYPLNEISFQRLNECLDTLVQVKALHKPALLKALAQVISADGQVSATEVELYRAVGSVMDCPIPPIPH